MDKEDWLKAIGLNKEELIKWLNEVKEENNFLKDIIKKYEEEYATVELKTSKTVDPETLEDETFIYYEVEIGKIHYIRHWV